MFDLTTLLIFVAFAYLAGGTIKGVIGLGLPTISIGVLSLFMPPVQAAAIMVVPAYATNVWQALNGPCFRALLRRFWTLYVGALAGSWLTAGILTNEESGLAAGVLGALLAAYAVFSLSNAKLHVPPRAEPWLSPLIGVMMGAVLGATGVFVMPAVPYMQALKLGRDELVQAIGMLFCVGLIALTSILLTHDLLPMTTIGVSAFALAPAILGMVIGRRIRERIDAETFRRVFLIGMLILGLSLAARSFLL